MSPDLPSIADAGAAIRAGTLTSVELTEHCLDRIATIDPVINAYHVVMAAEARTAARSADDELRRGTDRGPLHGIPIALKDVFYWQGHKTTSNSRVMLDFEADEDATVITRLKEAGAVLLGQLNTYEFTFGGRPSHEPPFPPALNPWNTARITGGSSSGSGAAVAAGLCLGALGTDAGGSIRLPAAFNGIAGLKPTIGLWRHAPHLLFRLRWADGLEHERMRHHAAGHRRIRSARHDERPRAGGRLYLGDRTRRRGFEDRHDPAILHERLHRRARDRPRHRQRWRRARRARRRG